jgi:hypothetical protein
MGTEVVNRDGRLHRVTQPVDVPHGWEWPGAGPEACVPFTAAGGFLSMETAVAHHTMPSPASRHRPRPAVELPGLPVPPAPPTAGARRGRRFWRAGPEGLAATTSDDLAASDGLDAYRRRAAELARELRATLEPALGPRLGAMAARLAALVADLESVGADPSAIQPLRDLVAALAGPSGDPRGLRDRAVEALLEFAREGP